MRECVSPIAAAAAVLLAMASLPASAQGVPDAAIGTYGQQAVQPGQMQGFVAPVWDAADVLPDAPLAGACGVGAPLAVVVPLALRRAALRAPVAKMRVRNDERDSLSRSSNPQSDADRLNRASLEAASPRNTDYRAFGLAGFVRGAL